MQNKKNTVVGFCGRISKQVNPFRYTLNPNYISGKFVLYVKTPVYKMKWLNVSKFDFEDRIPPKPVLGGGGGGRGRVCSLVNYIAPCEET